MRKNCLIIGIVGFFFACSSEDNSVVSTIDENTEFSVLLKTLSIETLDYNLTDPESAFTVTLEVDDGQAGQLLERLDLFATYVDQTPDNGDETTTEVAIQQFPASEFNTSNNGNPTLRVASELNSLLTAFNISSSAVTCGDQIRFRFEAVLTDGRKFSTNSTNARIISILDSPFEYVANIVTSIPTTSFAGTYDYETITEGFFGPAFGSGTVQITTSAPNRRSIPMRYIVNELIGVPVNEGFIDYEFTVACDQIIFSNFQIAIDNSCIDGGDRPSINGPILLGPDMAVIGSADPNDDSVFDLYFVEGYQGWNGTCDFVEVRNHLRFTKQ